MRARHFYDELILGLGIALALHIVPVAYLVYRAGKLPPNRELPPEKTLTVIGAELLKAGTPLDEKKLPDRVVPQKALEKRNETTASREDPLHKTHPDAGVPLQRNADDADLSNLIKKSDPFGEDQKRARLEEGRKNGTDEGTVTDEARVKAGDLYAATLTKFFRDRWQIPTVIQQEDVKKLCVKYQIAVGANMVIWQVEQKPVKPNENFPLFDDSAHSMLQKLADNKVPLPEPPPEIAESYRGRTIRVSLNGDSQGGARCP